MLEKHRAVLRALIDLVDDLGDEPSAAALENILTQLDALIDDVVITRYTGIELTILRMIRAVLARDIAGMLAVPATTASAGLLKAACRELFGAMSMLATPPKPVTPFAPDPEARPSSPFVITTGTYICQGDQLWQAEVPDAPFKQVGFIRGLVLLRDAGVTHLEISRAAALSLPELSLMCNAARKSYAHYPELSEMVCNLAVQSSGAPTIYARLVVTNARTHVYLSFETHTLGRPVASGVNSQQVIAQLRQEFKLGEFKTAEGRVWAIEELLEIQAAFTRIPAQDRPALENLVLMRRKVPVSDPQDVKQTAASYTPSTHTFTVLDRAFVERKTFVGGGLDAQPYCHMTILHEMGHVMEPWFQTAPAPEPERVRKLTEALERILADMKALGKQINEAPLGADALAAAKAKFEILKEERRATEGQLAISLTKGMGGECCLSAFALKVEDLRLHPVTVYAWQEWPLKPFEFWAECYSLFLTDPSALEFVSPPLFRWFRDGGYRVGSRAVPPLARRVTGLTTGQAGALHDVQSHLDFLCYEFEKVKAVTPDFVEKMRGRLAKLTPAFTALRSQMSGEPPQLLERVVVDLAMQALIDEVAAPLGIGATAPLTLADLPVLRSICERERAAFTALTKPPQAPVPAATKRIAARTCTITLNAGGGTVTVGTEQPGNGLPLLSLTSCLVNLRDRGVRGIRLLDCETLSTTELTWLCNAARRVYADCGSRFGIAIDTAVLLPAQRKQYFIRVTFADSGTLRLRFVAAKDAGTPVPALPTAAQVQEQLRTRFGIAQISGTGVASWSVAELVQLCDAFALLPSEDQAVLRGCHLVRKSGSSGATVEDTLAEEQRRGSYHPGTHTLFVIDSVFADAHGFVGNHPLARPRSHVHLLRLVAYAVLHRNGAGALHAFTRCVAQLGVRLPLTEEGQLMNETDPDDLFAEAYSLRCNEPILLEWVSPALADWLARGAYRGGLQ